jgi:hypothetical protein
MSPGALVVEPEHVQFRPEIEPVVRWIEETPRERILEVAIEHLQNGLSYRELLAALFLAGVRNIKPRPVGFKFHAVMVINSAHLLGQSASVDDRLLPLFWALDNFKSSQLRDVEEGDWTMGRVDEARISSPSESRAEFVRAMDAWDEAAADAATASLCRNAGAAEAMELFWKYGVRDVRNIGHKAIYTMQCWRTLQTVGWQHAEPVLRSLAFALLDLQGDTSRAPAGPYESNTKAIRSIREGWTTGKPDPGATKSMLATIRTDSPDNIAGSYVDALNKGVSPDSLWDATILGASEMLLRAPGIVTLHAVTAANALHYAYQASGVDYTRKLALLQGATWLTAYRDRVRADLERQSAVKLDELEASAPKSVGSEAIEEILAEAGNDRTSAARKALGYLKTGSVDDIFAAARRSIFRKGRDSHDYKYGAAIWEEAELLSSPTLRPNVVASMLARIPAASTEDSPLMRKAIEASRKVVAVS